MSICGFLRRALSLGLRGLTSVGVKAVTGPAKDASGMARDVTGIRKDIVETKLAQLKVEEHDSVIQKATFEDVKDYDLKVQRIISRASAEQQAGEAPPLIKYIMWLLRGENWRRHWLAIVLAILVAAGIAFRARIYPKVMLRFSSPPTGLTSTATSPPVAGSGIEHLELLTEAQIRTLITKALNGGDAERAIELLRGVHQGTLKREECEHVFQFCKKNGKLEDARTVVDLCWQNEQKEEKLRQIEMERLKR
jgi:hypothetical protein